MRWLVVTVSAVAVALAAVAAAYKLDMLPGGMASAIDALVAPGQQAAAPPAKSSSAAASAPAPAAVTVKRVTTETLVETALVTGTLVARDEILVSPEVEGLRIIELHVDAGDRVERGQLLATLESATLEAQLAQNAAALKRADALIAQARSQIVQAEAAAKEAAAAFERARPLNNSGIVSDSTRDQREAAARTTAAQVVAARDGLKVAEASKAEAEALRRDLSWRLEKSRVTAPRAGLVSRRTANVGGTASAGAAPLFRIVADGEIELAADVTEAALARIKPGQIATVDVAGAGTREGRVRLVSPEVDRATRLGNVRIALGSNPSLRVGAFGRGRILTGESRGLAVPAAAVLFNAQGAIVQRITNDRVETVAVRTGLRADGLVEILSGLADGDLVVAKAGTFLRHGDAVRPIVGEPRIGGADSDATRRAAITTSAGSP